MNMPHEKPSQRREPDHFKIRMNSHLRQWIKIRAAMNNRTMTGEILHALNAYRAEAERQETAAAK